VGSSPEPTVSMNPEPSAAQIEGRWGQQPAWMLSPEHPGSGVVWGNECRGAVPCEPCALGWSRWHPPSEVWEQTGLVWGISPSLHWLPLQLHSTTENQTGGFSLGSPK